jgi:dTDP-4-dehydrorhamnose reductase
LSGEKKILRRPKDQSIKPLLIIGKRGTLGYAFQQSCSLRSLSYVALDRTELDILDEVRINEIIAKYRPWGVINTAGYVRVDDAEANFDACYAANVTGALNLARACKRAGIGYMTFSSDLVFNGHQNTPYAEQDKVSPLNVYGHTKAEAERLILEENPAALVIRTSAFFGPWDKYNFAFQIVEATRKKEPIIVPKDIIISPTYVPDLCNRSLDLFIDEEHGIWHVANEGSLSWAEFGTLIMDHCDKRRNVKLLQPIHASEMEWQAKRPMYSVLKNEKGINLPLLENAVDRFFKELQT